MSLIKDITDFIRQNKLSRAFISHKRALFISNKLLVCMPTYQDDSHEEYINDIFSYEGTNTSWRSLYKTWTSRTLLNNKTEYTMLTKKEILNALKPFKSDDKIWFMITNINTNDSYKTDLLTFVGNSGGLTSTVGIPYMTSTISNNKVLEHIKSNLLKENNNGVH